VMLVNARHVRKVPGRKTVSDAAWLAELGAHGLFRASFVPPEPIRVLRDLTRARTTIAGTRAKEIGRLETLLEDAGVKLSSVACEITGVSGRAMLEALIAGQRDPAVLDLAKRQLRKKIPALTEALQRRFNDHHAGIQASDVGLVGVDAIQIPPHHERQGSRRAQSTPVRESCGLRLRPAPTERLTDLALNGWGHDGYGCPEAIEASWAMLARRVGEQGPATAAGHPQPDEIARMATHSQS
jgi:hypothetical protein